MVVQHNMTAINANRYFGINNTKLSKSLEKLSSGYAINRAGDNAAGLAVSEKMRSQIAGINQGVKNAQDGISMVQTYEGALTETDSILQRMKTLATQAANGSYDDPIDRNAIQQEFDQLNDELDQIADTDFNGVCMLNGGYSASGVKMSGGPASQFKVVIDSTSLTATTTNTDSTASGEVAFTYEDGKWTASKGMVDAATTDTSISYAGHVIDVDTTKVDIVNGSTFTVDFTPHKDEVTAAGTNTGNTFTLGTTKHTLKAASAIDYSTATKTVNNAKLKYEGGAWGVHFADNSSMSVDDFTANFGVDLTALTEAASYDSTQTTADPVVALTDTALQGQEFQINITKAGSAEVEASYTIVDKEAVSTSNAYSNGTKKAAQMTYTDNISLQVGARSKDLVNFTFAYKSDGIGTLKADLNCTSQGLGTAALSLASQGQANAAIDKIDHAINKVSMVRGTFGAIQNRLEHKIDNLNVTSENLTSAESRIRDTNMAEEMMNFTKNQILSQASQSMLAQANQLPQGVLSLLQ